MNCGCSKHIGCYVPGQVIDFEITAPCTGDYTFEIFGVGGTYSTAIVPFNDGDSLVLPMTFNENGETTIKIKVPDCAIQPGWHYFTTPDGACSWTVSGISPVC